jgi:membrane protein YqaA with SNARE-associated domain
MSESTSLLSLFISSLLGATLLPGGSEAVLLLFLTSYPDSAWTAVAIATLGNTLGGMVSFGMGWMLPQTQTLKHVSKVRHYGTPVLLLAWTPLLGDALCLAAGWLRLNIWQSALFMAVGKLSRYAAIVAIAQHT